MCDGLLAPAAADVDLDGEPQPAQPARRAQRLVDSVRHHLELHLVVPVDKRHKVKQAELRVPLQHRAQRGTRRLLEVVEKEHRAVGQRLLHQRDRCRRCRRRWRESRRRRRELRLWRRAGLRQARERRRPVRRRLDRRKYGDVIVAAKVRPRRSQSSGDCQGDALQRRRGTIGMLRRREEGEEGEEAGKRADAPPGAARLAQPLVDH